MTRDVLTFCVAGDTLHATLDTPDEGARTAGLLLVSGGNEIRSGAFAGQAALAHSIAAQGYPVFRFDRRGIGDSEGENGEFRSSEPDIRAALAAFRQACPAMQRVVGFGNCDGAAALMLASGAGCDALVLANPWTFDDGNEDAVPAEAVRRRYAEKLLNPREWLRLLGGKVSITGALASLKSSLSRRQEPMSELAQEMLAAMEAFNGPYRFCVAGADRTGIAFRSAWPDSSRIAMCERADHAFSSAGHTAWLEAQILAALDEQARQFDMG